MKKRTRRKIIKQSVFGRNLMEMLQKRDLTIKALAKLADIKPSTLADWAGGTAPSDLIAIKRVADILDCDFEWLCTGTLGKKGAEEIPLDSLFEETGEVIQGIYKIKLIALKRRRSGLPPGSGGAQ